MGVRRQTSKLDFLKKVLDKRKICGIIINVKKRKELRKNENEKAIVLDEKEIEILAKFADFLEHFVDEAAEPSRVCKLCPPKDWL